MLDCIVIGAGPAGLSAALYAARSGLNTIVLDKFGVGGQLNLISQISNYPGVGSVEGWVLASQMWTQVLDTDAGMSVEEVVKVERPDKTFVVTTKDNIYQSRTVIYTAGGTPRLLGLENRFFGKGVSTCAVCDGFFYKGKTVAVVGGGNTALTSAVYLSGICEKVYLVVRRDIFRASVALQHAVRQKDNIEVLFNTTVEKLQGDATLGSMVLCSGDDSYTLEVAGLFECIGVEPEVEPLGTLPTLLDGYIKVDSTMHTRCKGLFAAGDCIKKELYQVVTAVSDGAIAATGALNYLRGIDG